MWVLLLPIYYPLQFLNLLVHVNHITFHTLYNLSFFCRSRTYSSKVLVIKSIASLNEFNWLSPLIWLSFVFFTHQLSSSFFQLFHAAIKNCYTVFWLQRFSKNIRICGIRNRIVQAGLSRSLWIISIIGLIAQISFLFVKKICYSIILQIFY